MKQFYIISFLIIFTFLNATIINIPANQPTIQAGINEAVNGDTVLVQPGTYVENINYNGKLITVASLYLTTVDSSYISSTIIDGNSSGRVVAFNNGEDSTAVLCGFTITNGLGYDEEGGGIYCSQSSPTLENLIISGNFCFSLEWNNSYGGGIYCFQSSPSLENVVISENQASGLTYSGKGGGIFCNNHSNPILQNVTITGNSVYGSNGQGGGIYCFSSSNPSLINVTITGNSATYYGGGIFCENDSNPILVNCIMWNDSPEEIYFSSYFDPNTIVISYSDIEGGETGIVTNNNGIVNWLEGNIDSDPLFVDATNGDYHLQSISPCIDAGDPTSPYDPDGTIADMGAYYFNQLIADFTANPTCGNAPLNVDFSDGSLGNPTIWEWDFNNDGFVDSNEQNPVFVYDEVGVYTVSLTVSDGSIEDTEIKENYITVNSVSSDDDLLPVITQLYPNHPNPFNPITTIGFDIKEYEKGILSIFNIKGQLIDSCQFESGQHNYLWDASKQSSGIYFYKLETESINQTRKMLLLK